MRPFFFVFLSFLSYSPSPKLQPNESPMSCPVSLFSQGYPLFIWISGSKVFPLVTSAMAMRGQRFCHLLCEKSKSCEIQESDSTLENDLCLLLDFTVSFSRSEKFIVKWRRLLLKTTWDCGLTIRAKDQSLKLKALCDKPTSCLYSLGVTYRFSTETSSHEISSPNTLFQGFNITFRQKLTSSFHIGRKFQ